MNITSRLAVWMHHLPVNVDWNDTTSQRNLYSLTINDFMLSESEAEGLKQRAILYTALVKEFKRPTRFRTTTVRDPSCCEKGICSNESAIQGREVHL